MYLLVHHNLFEGMWGEWKISILFLSSILSNCFTLWRCFPYCYCRFPTSKWF